MTTVQEFTEHLNNLANRTVPTLLYLSERYAESEPRTREALAQVEAEMAQIIGSYTAALVRAEDAQAAERERCAAICDARSRMHNASGIVHTHSDQVRYLEAKRIAELIREQ